MNAILIALLVCQTADAPLRPPVLIDENSAVVTITGVEPLAPGTVCLTKGKADLEAKAKVSCQGERDDFRAQNGQHVSTPLIVVLVLTAVAVGAAAGAGVCAAAHCGGTGR